MTASRGMNRLCTCLSLMALLAMVPPAAQGQVACIEPRSVGLAPVLLQDRSGERSPGLGASAHACRIGDDVRARFPRSAWVGVRMDAVVPLRDLGLPRNVEAALEVGLSIALSERRPLDLDDDPDADFFRFDYGFAAVGARLGYEASADFAEQAVVGGVELGYVNPGQPLLPSLVMTGEVVRPTSSDVRRELDVDRRSHGRVGIRGYWLVRLPAQFSLELDAAVFRALGMEDALETEGRAGGGLVAVEVGRGLDRALGRLVVESLFVGYAHGQRPTGPSGRAAWTLGARIGFDPG
jgi:hypothetical protein